MTLIRGILNKLSEDSANAITNSKLSYYRRIASKSNDPNSAPNSYWSILKSLVNSKKIPLISSVLVKDQLVANFLKKVDLFNEFFTQQCNAIENETTERISSFDISKDEITKIIRCLDPNNAFQTNGRKQMLCQFTKKAISS